MYLMKGVSSSIHTLQTKLWPHGRLIADDLTVKWIWLRTVIMMCFKLVNRTFLPSFLSFITIFINMRIFSQTSLTFAGSVMLDMKRCLFCHCCSARRVCVCVVNLSCWTCFGRKQSSKSDRLDECVSETENTQNSSGSVFERRVLNAFQQRQKYLLTKTSDKNPRN